VLLFYNESLFLGSLVINAFYLLNLVFLSSVYIYAQATNFCA
jgi:hypothetical protein